MFKKIVLILLVLGLIGVFIGYRMYNKPHTDILSVPSVADLSAEALITAFKENEVDANSKYLDKTITVTGKIISVKSENDKTVVQLESNDPMSSIICNLDPFTKHLRTEFAEGESVQFKGSCSGYLSDVVLDRCVEIKK